MNKRKIHHIWIKLRKFNPWIFFCIAIMSGVVFVFSYRQNNITAIKLRDIVLNVDKQNGDTEAALKELRIFTYSHMNSGLSGGANAIYPPIQLKYRYDRLIKAENDRVTSINNNVYKEAQVYCEQAFPNSLSGGPRVSCIENYVLQNGTKAHPISDALYKFDFVDPNWSPDLAGWSLIISILSFSIFILLFSIDRWIISTLSKHQ